MMYANFKAWVEQQYPHGISEDEWEKIIEGGHRQDRYQVIIQGKVLS